MRRATLRRTVLATLVALALGAAAGWFLVREPGLPRATSRGIATPTRPPSAPPARSARRSPRPAGAGRALHEAPVAPSAPVPHATDGALARDGALAPAPGSPLRVRGRLRDDLGEPVAFASVVASVTSESATTPEASARSRGDGSFELDPLEGIAHGKLCVRASTDGATLEGETTVELDETASGPLDVGDVILRAFRQVTVVVREGGSPVREAHVVLADETERFEHSLHSEATDDAGEARFRTASRAFCVLVYEARATDFVPDPRELLVGADPRRAWTPAEVGVTPRSRVLAPDERSVRVEIELAPSREVRGVVRAPDGRPVAGARVSGPCFWIETETDEEGRFVLRGLAAGLNELRVQPPDRDELGIDLAVGRAVCDAPAESVVLVLGEAGSLVVRVTPALEGRVQLFDGDHGLALERLDERAGTWSECSVFEATPHTKTRDEATEVSFEHLAPATYRVRLHAQGSAPLVSWPVLVSPQRESTVSLERARGRTVAGRVVDEALRPLAGVRVSLEGDRPASLATTTDERGAFELGGLPEEDAGLVLERPGFAPAREIAFAGASRVADVVLERRR